MALYENVENGIRTIQITESKDVEFEWRRACFFWWGKYSDNDPDTREALIALISSSPFTKFCANWQADAGKNNQILFSFPVDQPEELTITAIAVKKGEATFHKIVDPKTQKMGLDDNGRPTISRRFGGTPPKPVKALIVPPPAPSKAIVEEATATAHLRASAERVSAALKQLVAVSEKA
jgi:hypothetical protein